MTPSFILAGMLDRIASGAVFSEAALKEARDTFPITEHEKVSLERWLAGEQNSTDHLVLQDIAVRLRQAPRKREVPASALQSLLTDPLIDQLLSTQIPGGSAARDWFLPHDTEKGLANVRGVVRSMVLAMASKLNLAVAADQASKAIPLTLNGHQLAAALEFAAPDGDVEQLESRISIAHRPAGVDAEDGESYPAGLVAWLTEHPEEGSIPLPEEAPQASLPVSALEPAARENGRTC